jgi:nucleotide-binding universal stress UspA family protein
MKMLICSIGSKRRNKTLQFAALVAEALAAETTLLGVTPKRDGLVDLGKSLDKTARRLSDANLLVRMQLEAGNAENLVMDELEQTTYDLVAIGALGGKRSRQALLDSVGMRIVERTENSVLLIKGNRSQLSRILICASGTERGHMPVRVGSALACAADAQATVLHVIYGMPAMYTGLEQMEETLAEMLQSETEMARELRWAAGVVRDECEISELKLRRGIVVDEILLEGQAGDYDLIVLGSSVSSSGLVRIMMGNMTREVVSQAQRPVLVVRPPGSDSDVELDATA